MATDPLTGARYPTSSNAPNVNQDIQNAVNDLSPVAVPQFASTGARDTAYTNWTNAGHTLSAGLCLVNGAPQMYRGKWVTVDQTLYRRVAATASGTLAPGGSVNVCAAQTIPASPFGTSVTYCIDVDAVIHLSGLPSGTGAKIELLYDGVLQGGDVYSNAGSTGCQATLKAREVLTVGDNSSHTITAVLTNLAGGGTLTADTTYGRLLLAIRPFVLF